MMTTMIVMKADEFLMEVADSIDGSSRTWIMKMTYHGDCAIGSDGGATMVTVTIKYLNYMDFCSDWGTPTIGYSERSSCE